MSQGKQIVCFLLSITISNGFAQTQSGSAEQQSPYDCFQTNVRTVVLAEGTPGQVEHNTVSFGGLGRSSIEVDFRNRASRGIEELALVIEYLDASGEAIDQVPLFSSVNAGVPETNSSVLSPAQSWKRPLQPGAVASLVSVRDGVRTGRCPVRSRVTFAAVRFTGEKLQTFASPGWKLGPSPVVIPRMPDNVPDPPAPTPASVLVKLKISASGSVEDIIADRSNNAKLIGWLLDRMRDWRFHPALLNGAATESEIAVRFLIHGRGMPKFVEPEPFLQPVTLIQFVRSQDLFANGQSDKWTVMYGLLSENSAPDYPLRALLSNVAGN